MITLHHLNNSRSQRILWMLEEVGIPYQITYYERDAKTLLAPPSLKAIHPLGKAPVLIDGELALAESGLIIEYLNEAKAANRYLPDDHQQRWQARYWLHYAEGSLMPFLLLTLVFNKIKTSPMPFFVKPIARGIADKVLQTFVMPNLNTHLDYIERHLAQHEWFAGEQLSIADFQMVFPLEAALNRAVTAASHPQIARFVQQIQQRPAYRRALEQGGPYDYA
ncbi:glutathione S-transferase family protein [Oceanobacter mangrovi]|uniref:glutathione S-transferase family protein n=1 Tax=Oceanobacter mangrovi TaxID=2862510 RepID=UPI001C8DAAF8|nr:glutathione S-transferase [Oceanobacter mangrovi]